MKNRTDREETRGSAVVAVLGVVTILSLLAGTVILTAMNRHVTLNQAAAWDRALVAAESGVHQALAQLENELDMGRFATGTNSFRFALNTTGEGPAVASGSFRVTRVDYPRVSGTANLSGTLPYYNVIATGSVPLRSSGGVSMDTRDAVLRKLNLMGSAPSAVRTINAWIKPRLSTQAAITVDGSLVLNNRNLVVSSFNSSDPDRTYTGAPQTWLPGQHNTDPNDPMLASLATNGPMIQASNATVYGDAMTNGGMVNGSGNVMGNLRDDFYTPIAPITTPSWVTNTTTTTKPGGGGGGGGGGKKDDSGSTLTLVSGTTTVMGGTKESPTRLTANSLTLNGGDVLQFSLGMQGSNTDPSKAYVELYVSGNLSTLGNGQIIIQNGVNVTIYVTGNLSIAGNGLVNQNTTASSLSLLGVNPPTGTTQTFEVGGTSTFVGTINAPGAEVKLGGTSVFVGSVVAKTATLIGDVNFFYDEALEQSGYVVGFSILSWYEETKRGS